MASVALRLPSTLTPTPSTTTTSSTSSPSPSITPPSLSWLSGTWSVTHSTLPMWRKSRNVRITYTPIPNTTPLYIDDEVTYQPLTSTSLKTVRGVDKPFDTSPTTTAVGAGEGTATPRADVGEQVASLGYNWRGKGWLMIASSKWEILGHGEEHGTGNSWVVTYFAKTLFTPAGVDFYSRKGSLAAQTVEDIKAGLKGLGGTVAELAGEVFEVKMDGERGD